MSSPYIANRPRGPHTTSTRSSVAMVTAIAEAAAGSAFEVLDGPILALDQADTVEVHDEHSLHSLVRRTVHFEIMLSFHD